MISLCCPNCQNTLKVGVAPTSERLTCPKCSHTFAAEEASAPPAPIQKTERKKVVSPEEAFEFEEDDFFRDGPPVREWPPAWLRRIGGCFFILVGTMFTAWMWHMAFTQGKFIKGMAFGPAFVVLGIAMQFFAPRQLKGEDGRGLSGLGVLVVVLGVLASVINFFLVMYG